MILFHM